MSNLNIHNVKSITVKQIKEFNDFYSREIIIEAENEKVSIDLYSRDLNEKDNLKISFIEIKKEE